MGSKAKDGFVVLIADDDRILLRSLRRTLGAVGVPVRLASTLQETLLVAREALPRIIVLDLDFGPEGSALDILPELMEAAPDARIIIFTGNVDREAWIGSFIRGDRVIALISKIDIRILADFIIAEYQSLS